MRILNYSHPLSVKHVACLEQLTGEPVTEVLDIPTHLDPQQPFAQQIVTMVEGAGFTAEQWQTELLLVVLPALNYAAAALLAEIHGRMGYFPPMVRLRPVSGALPPRYEVAEIINLQAMRDAARQRRCEF